MLNSKDIVAALIAAEDHEIWHGSGHTIACGFESAEQVEDLSAVDATIELAFDSRPEDFEEEAAAYFSSPDIRADVNLQMQVYFRSRFAKSEE